MVSNQERIPNLSEAKKDELVEKFGGKRSDWRKYKTVDEYGQEWHYYHNKSVGRVGRKRDGEVDPF